MLQTITSIVNTEQTVDSLPKRKRVVFDPEGVLLLFLPSRRLIIAMSIADKQEKNPTKANTSKISKYRKTADFGLNSASAWNDFNLDLLGVEYVKAEYHELPKEVDQFSVKEPTTQLRQRNSMTDRADDKVTKSLLKAPTQ
jgi:hypothetical protein